MVKQDRMAVTVTGGVLCDVMNTCPNRKIPHIIRQQVTDDSLNAVFAHPYFDIFTHPSDRKMHNLLSSFKMSNTVLI